MWFGLATRRKVVLPSWKGWLVLAGLTAVSGLLFIKGAYHFLALNRPLPHADILLVEGWVSDGTLAEAKRQLDAGRADLICTVGVEINRGQQLQEWKTWANLAGESLKRLGVPPGQVRIAPGGSDQRHRTYRSFRAAKEQLGLRLAGSSPIRINIVSEAQHARRSALVARKVFHEENTVIGVIAVPPESYDHLRWWASSSGVKHVLMELMAVAYEILADGGRP